MLHSAKLLLDVDLVSYIPFYVPSASRRNEAATLDREQSLRDAYYPVRLKMLT